LESQVTTSRKGKRPEKNRISSQPEPRELVPGHPGIRGSITHAIIIKQGDLYFVTEPDGSLPLETGHGFGLYYHDCRFLNGYELRMAGLRPHVLVRNAASDDSAILGLANPEIKCGRRTISKQRIEIRWSRVLSSERLALFDTITFKSFATEPIQFPLTLQFCAKFEDVFVVRGHSQNECGACQSPMWKNGELTFVYKGADSLTRSVIIHFSPEPEVTHGASADFNLELTPKRSQEICVSVFVAEQVKDKWTQNGQGRRPARVSEGRYPKKWPEIHSDNLLLSRIMDRSLRDLEMLRSELDGFHYFAAGAPWFVALFGRDSIITALQTLVYSSRIAEQTLRLLAKYQGTKIDRSRDEEPGKILHELRVGEMAHTGEVPYSPYFGTIDATPLWLVLLAKYIAWTADLRLFHELRSNVEAALNWMEQYGDCDGDGYLEYESKTKKGLANHGWKDSGDAIANADGSLVRPPIALAEVQGYSYQARLGAAGLFRRIGDCQRAADLERKAQQLRYQFNRDFWVSDGYFALALQKDKSQAAVLSSNAGQVLWSGIADDQYARQTATRLLSPEMFNNWGIRTLSTEAIHYNPLGYHLGTVWPHDNSLIAAGFKRYKLDEAGLRLLTGMVEAAEHFDGNRLPELFAGFSKNDYGTPVSYPLACQPQAWAAGALPYLLSTLLGLEADAFSKKLSIVRPMLPENVNKIEIRRTSVAGAEIDLVFERSADGVEVRVSSIQGELDVEVQR
jgi:glycogen debranching enzyme